ncbi:uncharacterized protein BDW70DRAFT_143985 [Aspergillus foveolatus]|uniref:uncharacterized protein n=1 Tax=Aspergillus foveolatus TaxID=210207 RepID=UPI003CCE066B
MSSSILHSCPSCGHVTDISEILTDFVGDPHCTQCGLSASEGKLKAQDDLVSLFNTHMSIGQPRVSERPEVPATPSPITYSITQHYHHSAHVAQRAAMSGLATPQNVALPVTSETVDGVLEVLMHHRINPSTLSTSQLELFANAMPDQRNRLIQMWQIYPEPRKIAQSQAVLTRDLEMSDSAQVPNTGDITDHSAEPYMLAGYGLVAHDPEASQANRPSNELTTCSPYRIFSDPVYQAGGQRWWERTQAATMEN